MCKIYGYARISTKKQSIDRQIRNIKQSFPDAIIRQEVFTGRKYQGRDELKKILSIVKPGDTIVFDSVSRMSRNAEEGIQLYFDLYNKGVNLVFLKENYINTSTYKDALNNQIGLTGDDVDCILEGVNKYLIKLAEKQIKIAFEQAQKEVDDLSQRTKEGLVTARMNNKQVGQKEGKVFNVKRKAPIIQMIMKNSKDFGGNLNDEEMMALLAGSEVTIAIDESGKTEKVSAKVSRNTYYRYKKAASEIYVKTVIVSSDPEGIARMNEVSRGTIAQSGKKRSVFEQQKEEHKKAIEEGKIIVMKSTVVKN